MLGSVGLFYSHFSPLPLQKTTDECVQILSAVCRILSLANFTLCFPGANHWQRNVYDDEEKSLYVGYVLDQIFLPTIRATQDIVILKLILKLICEAWLDFIYQKRIRFSVNGALRLLNDFDDVRVWILACPLLDEQQLDKLSNHEVLRMCKGVGKILLRKPEDVISITQSPKFDKKSRKLPREQFDPQMFNQPPLFLSLSRRGRQCAGHAAAVGDVCLQSEALAPAARQRPWQWFPPAASVLW